MPTARVLDALQVLVSPPDDGDGDGECLQRFLAGRDEAAFAELVRRHGPMVYGACQRVLANGPEADDAFQATFFVLARKADTIRGNVRSWLYGVAVRVARKARVQAIRRRVRQMAAAKPEAVLSPPSDRELWAVLDEELAKLPEEQRQTILACDLNGLSRSKAALELGWPEGTVAKRLTKARQTLAARLTRRGISLSAGALSLALAERATATVPGTLLLDTARQAVSFAIGGGGGSLAVQALAEGFMRSLKVGVLKLWLFVGLLAATLAGGGMMLADGPGDKKGGLPATAAAMPKDGPAEMMWKEKYATEKAGSLPVSVVYSVDGKTLLVGDTSGEVMACIFTAEEPQWKWKSNVDGSHAAVTFSADGNSVYVTTKDGVRILDAADGKLGNLIEAKDSNPIAVGVFPDNINAKFAQRRIIFGSVRGYFVKSWSDWGKPADTMSTIETNTQAKGAKPNDEAAVPLAVDPKGRSAIMTGPRDGTGEVTGAKGKNVLWAYVCGDYEKGSPGNRVMVGHTATVVSAAWAKDGATAVTGDADGRVITWDAKTMKEARRVEFGGRVAALAITDDGQRTAAYVLGKTGEVFVWDTAKPTNAMKPVHTDVSDFGGTTSHASLSFTPDGKRLAGCAMDKKWLSRGGELIGKARVWELAAAPKAQRPPKHLYTKELPKGSSTNFVVQHNQVMIAPSAKEGAIDYRDPKDGSILSRLILGKFAIGGMKVSSDRKWAALDQHAPFDPGRIERPSATFDVGVWEAMPWKLQCTIPSCSQTLDVASDGKVVAVVREKKVELWDVPTAKLLKAAPFQHVRIDAARFSPDGKLLALNDRNDLILWRWTEDAHERIAMGRSIGSLAFSPDGKVLAEGPSPRDTVQLRDVATRKVVHSLRNGAKQSLDVPRMAFAQGGRLLIAANASHLTKEIPIPHRILLWDTRTGEIAHEIAIPSGFPKCLDVTPNGRYLVASIEDGDGMKLSAWEIGGEASATAPPIPWREGKPIDLPSFPVQAIAVSPDGKMLAAATSNGIVSIHDPATGARLDKGRVAQLKAMPTRLGLAFSPKGKLAITGQNGAVVLDNLLGEVPNFVGPAEAWEGVPGFDPHQLVWIEDSDDGQQLIATDGNLMREVGWTRLNGQPVRVKGGRWPFEQGRKHQPTMLASVPGKRILVAGSSFGDSRDPFTLSLKTLDASPHSVRTTSGHKARPIAGAIASDGKLLLSGDEAGDLIAWEGAALKMKHRWKLGGAIVAIAIATDNATAAALRVKETGTATDWELYLFDLATVPNELVPIWKISIPGSYSKTEFPLQGPDGRTEVGPFYATLAFHPDGKKLYGSLGDPYVKVLKTDPKWKKPIGIRVWEKIAVPPAEIQAPAKLTWKAEEPIADPQFDIQSLAFSKDGTKFAFCSNGETLVYDTVTFKKLYFVEGCFPRFVDDTLLTWALVVRQYDAKTGVLLKESPKSKTEVAWQIAAFSPDGKTVAGYDGKTIRLIGTSTGLEARLLRRQGATDSRFPFKGVAWSPDGQCVAAFERTVDRDGNGGLSIWDVSTGERQARRSANEVDFNSPHACFAFAPDGRTIAVGGLTGDNERNSSLTILDAATMKNTRDPVSVRSRDGGADVTAIAYSPDGGTIAIGVKFHTGKGPLNRVQLFDAKTLELGESLLPDQDTAPITSIGFAPDGRTLIGTTGRGPHGDPQQKETLHRVLIWRSVPAN
jgi:RNA polymerase sigma factor (sigma-70 family)